LQRLNRRGDVSFRAVLTVRRSFPLLALVLLGLVVAACAAAGAATPSTSVVGPTGTPSATASAAAPATASAAASPSAAGTEIKCDLGGHDAAYHIHALVGVRIDGAVYAPPANIGIGTDCMYWVHTHNPDGIVHIEAPASVSPTLGDFMGLWAQSFPDDPLLKTARDAIAAGKVTVNDVPLTTDPMELVLEDRMRIILG
jgi:hypothetical protein